MEKLNELAREWLEAKAAEDSASKLRVAIEDQIVALTGKRDEGSQTHDLGPFKLTVKGVLYRKMDWDKWETVSRQIPVEYHPVKLKPELDEKGIKWLQEQRPELYALLPIEVRPGKTGVSIKAAHG